MADRNDELARLRAENARLVSLLEAHGIAWQEPVPVFTPSANSSLNTDEKIALFRQLFGGRTDVYPVYTKPLASTSLPDAEAGKNLSQHILGSDASGDLAQRFLRHAQFFGGQLR